MKAPANVAVMAARRFSLLMDRLLMLADNHSVDVQEIELVNAKARGCDHQLLPSQNIANAVSSPGTGTLTV